MTSPQEENQQQIFAPSNVQPQQVLAPPNVQPQQVLAPPNVQPQQVFPPQNVQPQQVFPPPDVPPQQVFPQNLPSQEISTQSSTPQVSLQPATVQSTPSFSTHTTQNTSRLPKLSLPTFNGNPLQWQTFWDSFNAAVHSNSNLSGVEKFNYLKAQASGEAARAISGFPLTNTNYEQAIALLNKRFGQSYKIVNAHMQALLNIPTPTNSLTSIRQFHDTIENHMRGLSALGKSEETYGDLLIPIILGKLPAKLQRNLAREQNNGTWTINLLRQAILKEIRIMEASNSINNQTKAFEEPNPPSMTTLMTDTNEQLTLEALVVPEIATPFQNHLPSIVPNLQYLKGLKLAHPVTANEQFDISLLIGVDYYWQIVQDEVIRGDGPIAVKSKLGYLLSGPVYSNVPASAPIHVANAMITHRTEEFDLERFWTIESLGITPTINDQKEDPLLEYQETSITRERDGGYVAAFPWKKEHPPLPTNYEVCKRRTRSMARRLAKTPDLLKTYGEIIADQEKREFIEKVQPTADSQNLHYIPHHPVIKESATTPVRIVYDCSCRQSATAPSLNDCLQIGTPLLTDMCSIILRFRTHPYAFSTDIEKAFLHVRLNEYDRDFTRFLWLSDPLDPESSFIIYRFKVVLFGSASSPFMLNATLHHHLDKHNTNIAQDMKENLYVDNLISGCDTEVDAVAYYEEARSTMNQGKFNLRSWASNSSLLQARTAEDNTNEKSKKVNILGLQWNPTTDNLTLAESSSNSTPNVPATKRKILQQSAKVYDPLGLLAPVTVRARILLQELWQRKLPWDTPVDHDLQQRWLTIAEDIQQSITKQATLPRQYLPTPVEQQAELQLHVFADASTLAFGTVAFLQQEPHTSFVMAKSRVAL